MWWFLFYFRCMTSNDDQQTNYRQCNKYTKLRGFQKNIWASSTNFGCQGKPSPVPPFLVGHTKITNLLDLSIQRARFTLT